MADTLPDRLSTNPRSPYFNMEILQRGIGVRFKGRERNDVDEYCLSESWIRVQAGKAVDRHGQPVTVKLTGPLEVWFADVGPDGGESEAEAEPAGPEGGEGEVQSVPTEGGKGEAESEAHPS